MPEASYLELISAKPPAPTVIAPPLDRFYLLPKTNKNKRPYIPMSVTGFDFDPATGTVDFSAVPQFDLGRLQYLRHVKSKTFLYARPLPNWGALTFAAVDGTPVPPPPTSGHVLKLKADTSGMLATDEITAAYDLPPGYVAS